MANSYIFSSESVTEGHPDKVADTISDAVLDACLKQDPSSRVACETLVKSNLVVVAGEITTKADFDYNRVVREAIEEIGYTDPAESFNAKGVHIMNALTAQSPDIAQGVDERAAEGKETAEQGAGDQGLMFGFACTETPQLMPAPIFYAHALGKRLTKLRKGNKVSWLRPDCKTQVSLQYNGNKIERIDAVVVSTQHLDSVKHKEIESFIIEHVIKDVLPPELLDDKTRYLVNPTGRFVIGGPEGDTGLTGRKIIVDSYGGMGRHGGGAFSGKDPSKVDRSAAYMGRYVAKNIVAAGLADWAEIQFAYAIGYPEPVSVHVYTFGTGKIEDDKITAAVREVFSFKPANIIKQLNLKRPIYGKTTNYGHFGRTDDLDALTWEKTDKVEELKRAVGAA
jgi:S-adenosylmethionine synthetase